MINKMLLLVFVIVLVHGNQEERTESLLRDLTSLLDERSEPGFDVINDDDVMSEVRRVIEDHGFDSDELLSDISFLYAIPGIFHSGDARRWTTLNFVYQLGCYQGMTGPLLMKAWWVYRRFNGYGCYCGGGHYDGNYLDSTDHCCRYHDLCYRRVMTKYSLKQGCDTYTEPYSVSCCKDQKYTKCTDSGPSAGRELCECDQAMASCAAKNAGTYSKTLVNNRSKCKAHIGTTKAMGLWDTIKSCKHAFTSVVTFPLTYGSQGTCPKSGGWWMG